MGPCQGRFAARRRVFIWLARGVGAPAGVAGESGEFDPFSGVKSMKMKWAGVMPATTTAFDKDLNIDHAFVGQHAKWLIDHGCTGIVTPGSLGESATLSFDEKLAIWKTVFGAVGERVPVVAAIASLSTAEAVQLAKRAADAGCSGLMVLPPYVYRSDWREMKAHIEAVFRATKLSCMLYNNPVAYGTDFLPEQIKELAAEHENFEAVKESSTDVRRVTWIRELVGDRLAIFVGVDDAIVERYRDGRCWLGRGSGECAAARVSRSFQLRDEWRTREGDRALQLVSAAAADGYGAEVCATD